MSEVVPVCYRLQQHSLCHEMEKRVQGGSGSVGACTGVYNSGAATAPAEGQAALCSSVSRSPWNRSAWALTHGAGETQHLIYGGSSDKV